MYDARVTRILLVFDVDGTLVNSADMIVAAQTEAFMACGLAPPTRAQSLSIVGLSLPEVFAVLAPGGPVEALTEAYRHAALRLRNEARIDEPLFPGMGDMIATLRQDPAFLLAIATGKNRRGVNHLLEKRGWKGVFASIQTADDAPSKPHPEMLFRASRETGIAIDNMVMIGDSTFDMAMARAAGTRALGVSWGFHAVSALLEAGADAIADDAAALRRMIDAFRR